MSAASVNTLQTDESSLFAHIAEIIETRKSRAGAYANREVTLMYWEIGRYINATLLGGKRAEYGKQIIAILSQQLVAKYGKPFESRNLRRMMQFAELFPDLEIVSPLATQLSWSHFIEILPLESEEAMAISRNISSISLNRKMMTPRTAKHGTLLIRYFSFSRLKNLSGHGR